MIEVEPAPYGHRIYIESDAFHDYAFHPATQDEVEALEWVLSDLYDALEGNPYETEALTVAIELAEDYLTHLLAEEE